MLLHVEFEQGDGRNIQVSQDTTVTVTVPGHDVFALQGLRAMYLTSDVGETLVGPDMSAEDVARSVGWAPQEEIQALRDEIGHLTHTVGQKETIIRELQRLQEREFPVTTQAGSGEDLHLESRRLEAEIAADLNAREDGLEGPDAAWAVDEEPVASPTLMGGMRPYGDAA